MKTMSLLLVILLSAATTLGTMKAAGTLVQTTPVKETRLEQIKRAGVLRCAYTVVPPVHIVDPNTGKMSGLAYDLFEEIGRQLGVKIEWTTEIVYPQVSTDLANNRYDVACSPFFVTPSRAREMLFSRPFQFHPAYLYVRADDARFDADTAVANSPDITFSTIDGEFSSVGANENFPMAKKLALPQNAQISDMLMNVAEKKADAVVTEPITFGLYNKTNPGKMKRAGDGSALRVMAVSFALPAKEYDLKTAIDETIIFLQGSGFIDSVLDKYEDPENVFLRLPPLYVLPHQKAKP